LHTLLHDDVLFPADAETRAIARRMYSAVRDLPIISPHGHTNAKWFADDEAFPNPTELLIIPDHYVLRMLYSQGIAMEAIGIGVEKYDPREVWRIFAKHYYLFRGTPSRMWFDYTFSRVFGFTERLSEQTADSYYDGISEIIARPDFRPRALFGRFKIEVITTTDAPNDSLEDIQKIKKSGWKGRVLPAFRPDPVVDPEFAGFRENIVKLGELTGEDTAKWSGYLKALEARRAFFKSLGATSTDHGHPTVQTADLSSDEAAALYVKIFAGTATLLEQELFRAQMLTEMARMSVADGLVMQIHPGSVRNHNPLIFEKFGRDKGADIPQKTEYTNALRPLLARFGNEPGFTLILFTLDETTYSRELAPMAGHYPCLRLGPPWWFHDSPEGMKRFREQATESAGFYNTVGFNDDTRAFLSIPARHDVARRVDCAFLARLVAQHQLDEDEAFDVVRELTVGLVKRAYKL
jgi:glucuronate isomerase